MTDIKSPTLIWIKGGMFVLIGVLASGLLLLQSPDLKVAALLWLAIWAFCRAYYFAFYVIQNYVDSDYRFAGLFDFLRYTLSKRRDKAESR